MNNFTKFIGGSGLVVAGFFGWATVLSSDASASKIELEPVVHAAYNPEKIDFDIKFHEGRVARDPKGAIGWRMLADAYLARSNESDQDDFAWKAEDAARRSIELRAKLNPGAFNSLTRSLLEQHRFQDALAQAKENVNRFPDDIGAHMILADAYIEVGQISQAAVAVTEIPGGPNPMATVAASRVARASGDPAKSISLLNAALVELQAARGISDQTLAWIHQQLGATMETTKEFAKAEAEYRKALVLYPRSYKAPLGLARIALETKRPAEAAQWAERTLKIAYSLDAIAIKGDAKVAQGDPNGAKEHYAEVLKMYRNEVARFDSLGKGGSLKVKPIDRQFASFAAHHKMFVEEGLEAAKRDFANRPDSLGTTNLQTLQKLANP